MATISAKLNSDCEWDDAGSDSEEDEEEEENLITILIIGVSGSGKSYLVKSLIEQFTPKKRPIVTLNDRTKKCPYKKIEWHQLKDFPACAVVIEDVISIKPKHFELVQDLVSVRCHHEKNNPVILVSHSLIKNNIKGLLNYFNYVYISAVNNSIDSFRSLLAFYGFKDDLKEHYIAQLKACDEEFSYFMLNVRTQEIILTRAEDRVILEEQKRGELGDKKSSVAPETAAAKFLSKLENPHLALILFEMVHPCLPVNRFNSSNLTVTLTKSGEEDGVIISLIDYIANLITPDIEPDYDMLKFHRYLTRKKNLHLPKTYVLNKRFWK
jgi:hypothetical protein